MEYNLLDRIMDEDYYGPGSAEFLLRGMSPEGQKRFIKDLSKSLSRKLVPGAGKETRAERKKFAQELESSINRMPEDLQDSWLISAGRPGTISLDNGFNAMFEASSYNPTSNKIVIKDNVNDNRLKSALHEVAHHSDFNMAKKRPYDGKKVRMSAAAFANLGDDIRNDVITGKTDNDYDLITGREKLEDDDAEMFDPRQQLLDNIYEFTYDTKANKDYRSGLKEQVDRSLMDWHSLNEKLPFDIAHGNEYRERRQLEGLRQYMGDPRVYPFEVAGDARRGIKDAEKAIEFSKQYPIAVEGPSNIYEILGTEGGAEWMRDNMKDSYAKMERLAKEDIRKLRYVPRSEKYADELGLELIAKNRERAAKRKQTLLDRYRADFMTLPEEKRNYYENAKPGDVLWLKSPEFEEGLNQYYVIKGDPHYEARGSKLYKVHDDSPLTVDKNKRGRFKKVLKPIDLNELAPDFVPTDKFDIEFPQHDSKKVLEALERSRKRRAK